MTVYVIDGQGGGVGRALLEQIRQRLPGEHIVAIGTNAAATQAMVKSGASAGATGENAVVYCARTATEQDIIAGPIGLMIANAMYGEISPAMTGAISASSARKVLIPMPAHKCSMIIVGVQEKSMGEYIVGAAELIQKYAMDIQKS